MLTFVFLTLALNLGFCRLRFGSWCRVEDKWNSWWRHPTCHMTSTCRSISRGFYLAYCAMNCVYFMRCLPDTLVPKQLLYSERLSVNRTTTLQYVCKKKVVLYSAVSSPLDRSKRFTLFALPDRPVQSDTNSASPGSILVMQQLRATTKSLTCPPLSIARYSFIQLSQQGRQWRERKCPIFDTVAKQDSNPGSLDCESGILPPSYRAPFYHWATAVCNACGRICRSATGLYSHQRTRQA